MTDPTPPRTAVLRDGDTVHAVAIGGDVSGVATLVGGSRSDADVARFLERHMAVVGEHGITTRTRGRRVGPLRVVSIVGADLPHRPGPLLKPLIRRHKVGVTLHWGTRGWAYYVLLAADRGHGSPHS